MFVCFIAQMVAALIERALRQNMARQKIKAIAILPEARHSKTPSCAQVLDTFAARTKDQLYQEDRLIKTFIDPLTEIQKTVLKLLDIAAAIFH